MSMLISFIIKLRPEGVNIIFQFSHNICDRNAEDKQVEKKIKSDLAFLRYCAPKYEVDL